MRVFQDWALSKKSLMIGTEGESESSDPFAIRGCLLSILLLGAPVAAQPSDPGDLIRVLQQRHCPDCRLADADLVHADLRDAQLAGARLQRANLGEARLDGADLSGSDLSFTSLRGASLRGADLRAQDV